MALRDLADDLACGFSLLTRLPMPSHRPRALAAWSWALVGVVMGGTSALAGLLALALGLPGTVAGLMAVAAPILVSGGLHEDGLADCADGFWGGRDKARRLEIMKDSRIGSYGVIALVLVLGLKAVSMGALLAAGQWASLLVAGALSRGVMAGVMAGLPNARGAGLSHLTGQPPRLAVGAGFGIALGLALATCGGTGLWMAALALAASLGTALVARAKIGGQTGDVLGASQGLAETLALLAALALLAPAP